MTTNKLRRKLILGTTGLIIARTLPALAEPLQTTPRQTAGPFYPSKLPLDDDNNLVNVKGRTQSALGRITDLTGKVVNQNGDALTSLRIEIWQCDANGRYRHPRESGDQPIDHGFQGFGQALTDDQGRYRFRTIRPIAYPGRTPHIHVAVFPEGDKPFITQLYVAGEPQNERDFLYQRISVEKRQLVTSDFVASTNEGVELESEWNIVMDYTPGET